MSAPVCGTCYEDTVAITGISWDGEPYALCLPCADYYGVMGRVCVVCGVRNGADICEDCEDAKGRWEDLRLDDYGRLIKH